MVAHTTEQSRLCKRMLERSQLLRKRQVLRQQADHAPSSRQQRPYKLLSWYGQHMYVVLQAQQAKPVHLIDVPGHPKVRNQFQGYLNSARGIVFVVDSVDFMGQKTAVAE